MRHAIWLFSLTLALVGFSQEENAVADIVPACDPNPVEACVPCEASLPTPCVKPCPKEKPKSAEPKICPPQPKCVRPTHCYWNFNPCNPKCSGMQGGAYLFGEFLYWRSENSGFSYAYEVRQTLPAQGKILRLGSRWTPAFRVGLGWNAPYDFWDLLLSYTWFRNHTSRTHRNDLGFLPLWPLSEATEGQYGAVKAKNSIQMNMGDLEFGRLLYLTKTIGMRPYLGLRGGNIYQKFRDDFSSALVDGLNAESFHGSDRMWGIGPSVGFQGQWHFPRGFSVIGKLNGALLYGKTHVQTELFSQLEGEEVLSLQEKMRDEFYQLTPNLQSSFGVEWQTCFSKEKMFFKISASWEANSFWERFNLPAKISTFRAPLPTFGSRTLTLEGLVFNAEIDF